MTRDLESVLLKVEKPSRYTGGELFQIIKNDSEVRIALSYPDLYEIGMANHGIKILYDVANGIEGVACERVFAVAPDFYKALKENGHALYTLETSTPLHQCDMIAFNLSHELLYSNILQILDLGNIPLLSRDRKEKCPVIIAGGEAVSNPSPIIDFVDLVFSGDGEEGFAEIAEILKRSKSASLSRESLMEKLAGVEGVFKPGGEAAVKRVYKGTPKDPVRPVIPSIRISQDRGVIEVMRGCSNLCKFCHAGYYHLPCRHYGYREVAQRARELLKNTGYNEITFLSLSISDYTDIVHLLNEVMPEFNEQGVSISLPSMKVDLRTLPIIEISSDIRKSSLTFALESASDDTRRIINKKLSIPEFYEILEYLFSRQWDTIKLYFMIGLPGYRDKNEAEEILDLLRNADTIGKRKKKINVMLSTFIPKPHTPFESEEMADEDYLLDTITTIRAAVPKRISIKHHDTRSSKIEGLLSRGDSAVSSTIMHAYLNGAMLDSWDEHFKYQTWEDAINKTLPDSSKYFRKRSSDEIQPWGSIVTGYEDLTDSMKAKPFVEQSSSPELSDEINTEAIRGGYDKFKKRYAIIKRYRLRFTKTGRSKYISHLDYIETIKRGLRILEFPVSFSQGFNKHERIAAGFPLPLGIESESELIDVEAFAEFSKDVSSIDQSLVFPEGIRLQSMREFDSRESIMSLTKGFVYLLAGFADADLHIISNSLSSQPQLIKTSKNGDRKDVSFSSAIHKWEIADSSILLTLTAGKPDSIRIDSVISQLYGNESILPQIRIIKQFQMIEDENGSLSPLS
jgi:radical SAM-linked protein